MNVKFVLVSKNTAFVLGGLTNQEKQKQCNRNNFEESSLLYSYLLLMNLLITKLRCSLVF